MASERFTLVTALGWLAVVGSALIVPISTISFLMILARSYGTSTFDPLGFLTVVVAPPVTLVAGIGLLRRKAWARLYIMALLVTIIAVNVYAMVRPPRPERRYVSPSGVPTTVSASPRMVSVFSVAVVGASVVALLILQSQRVRAEF
jgi:hypothetical protein